MWTVLSFCENIAYGQIIVLERDNHMERYLGNVGPRPQKYAMNVINTNALAKNDGAMP